MNNGQVISGNLPLSGLALASDSAKFPGKAPVNMLETRPGSTGFGNDFETTIQL